MARLQGLGVKGNVLQILHLAVYTLEGVERA